jgi:glycosyltransferase involved in cell wall biosynthesis
MATVAAHFRLDYERFFWRMRSSMRLAVVSPFLDRQHGTEMCVIEQIERFARDDHWRIELYAQDVSQMSGVQAGNCEQTTGICWHKISNIPGPHLLKFIWWFFANHWRRWSDQRKRIVPDLVYTPGTNCLDADAIMVQIVFHAFYEQARAELKLRRVPVKTWPRLIHRRLYYHLIMSLERLIYRNPRVRLVAVSNLVARQLHTFLGRSDAVVIPNTVDLGRFDPEKRLARRKEVRSAFQIPENDFVLLLIGNDWKKKGLDSALRALGALRDRPIRLVVAGRDDVGFYRAAIQRLGLTGKVVFAEPSPDVLQFYALADMYVGPSLEDGFNLPILEAMACGLPVIASIYTGASENITDGRNGMILRDPLDDERLAGLIREVYEDSDLRERIAKGAAEFVQQNCGWDQNAAKTRELLNAILSERSHSR